MKTGDDLLPFFFSSHNLDVETVEDGTVLPVMTEKYYRGDCFDCCGLRYC